MHKAPDDHINRIARSLSLDAQRLKAQWLDAFPRAYARAKDRAASAEDVWTAWKTVVAMLRDRRLIAGHPTETLGVALAAYISFVASTSGVEQSFSKTATVVTDRRGSMDLNSEEMATKLALDLDSLTSDELVAVGTEVWEETYGRRRRRKEGAVRADFGTKRKSSDKTEAQFIKKRRQVAVEAGCQAESFSSATLVARGSEWGAAHDKEMCFQRQKAQDKRVDALGEGTLLPHEITEDLRDALAQKRARQAAEHTARQKKTARDVQARRGLSGTAVVQLLVGKRVFVNDDCRNPAVAAALRRLHLRSCTKVQAEVFVVQIPGQVDEFIQAGSALRGGYQVSPQLLISNGERGVAVKMTSFAHLPKQIYFTPSFSAHQGRFCRFMYSLVATVPRCAWKVHSENWPALKASEKAGHLFAVCRSGEIEGFAHKQKFTLDGFLQRIFSKVDMSQTVSGV